MSDDRKKAGRPKAPKKSASAQTRRRVSAVLEVMAGTLTPTEAAEALNISVPKYYMIESKALEGMLEACEPRPVGYAWTPERELEAMKKEHEKLKRECDRYKALARAAQRAAGFNPPRGKKKQAQKGKRKRKPTVRALTLAKRLKDQKEDKPLPTQNSAEEKATAV
jgi:hypothetical protein